MIEGLASPVKDYLLKNYYGVSQEQIDQYSDPNEAFKQAMWAGGTDLVMGELMILNRWRKNAQDKRTLTQEDYDAIVQDLDGMKETLREFQEVTGVALDDNHLLVQAAAAKRGTMGSVALSTKVSNLTRRLGDKAKRILGNAQQVARTQIQRGLDAIQNRHITSTFDPTVLGIENGRYVPLGNAADRAEAAHRILEEDVGLPAARRRVADTEEAAEEAYEALADRHNPINYQDVQTFSNTRVAMAYENESLQWELFKDALEPNTRGVNNIVLANPKGSPIRAALDNLDLQAARNYSTKLGDQTANFVNDLEALTGDVLDIQQLQRLRSNLSYARHQALKSEAPDWNANDIGKVIDAIDEAVDNMPWIRRSTGRAVPAQREYGLKALYRARDATEYVNGVAKRDFIDTITRQIKVFDDNAMPFAGRRQFETMATPVRDAMFEPGNGRALRDFLDLAGHDPRFRAALADELEGIYKQMAYNADGTFKAGGFQQFRDLYGEHMNMVFGPQNAARVTTADQMARAVREANKVAKHIDDLFIEYFGESFNGAAHQGIVRNVMGSSKVSAAQVTKMMRRLEKISPDMATAVRAEFAQWMGGKMSASPITTKGSGALGEMLTTHAPKIEAIMGKQYLNDLQKVNRVLQIVDIANLSSTSPEAVQQAWLQVTRSLFGPLSRKQRFMTAFNRVMRNRGAAKALELMSDPSSLRSFIRLGKLDPTRLAFWAEARALGIEGILHEAGVSPPEDLEAMAAKQRELERVRMYGTNQ